MSSPLFINPGQPLTPDHLWSAWNFEPSLLLSLAVTAFIYGWGVRNLWLSAGAGQGITLRHNVRFLGAFLALLVALVSPLDQLSEVLFSAHMVQHLILILIAAPLLVTSGLHLALLWALPRRWAHVLGQRFYHSQIISRTWQMISRPFSAWVFFTITLWIWHSSALFESALRDETIHAIEHLTFLITAMLFWWVLFQHTRPSHMHYGMAIPYLFTSSLQSGILGALMTFSPQPWYAYYTALVIPWGLTPLQDQQLAGLIMWMPGGAVFTLLTIGYFAMWFRSMEQRSSQGFARSRWK